MTASILLARLIGPVLLVAGLTALFNPKLLTEMGREFLAGRALLFLAGVLAMLAGLAIVNMHNVWTGWPVIITLFGWISIAAGIVRMAFPDLARQLGERMLGSNAVLRTAGSAQLLLGAFLTVARYF